MVTSKLAKWVQTQALVLDGAMGTMLQDQGLQPGQCPEEWNVKNPQAIQAVHRAYIQAGANIIQTNTFGGNRYKLQEYALENRVQELNQAAVQIARKAAAGTSVRISLSVGPTGMLSKPYGRADFRDFYGAFAEQIRAGVEAGADLISLETMSDLQEARAALIAAKEHSSVPVLAQMTFEPNLRTLMGTDPATAAVVLEALGADAVGANCSGGPAELLQVLDAMAQVTSLPLVVQPNAGLPQLIQGKTLYHLTPEEMATYASEFLAVGAWVIGGCCGTNPAHIQAISQGLSHKPVCFRESRHRPSLTSRSRTIILSEAQEPLFIGERINPTARKKLAQDIQAGRMHMVLQEAQAQVEAGAPLLDVNMGVPDIDEAQTMASALTELQGAVEVPLVIDSTNPQAIEAGLQAYAGKALINSVNGEEKSLQAILPLARRYGAAVLGLALDEKGIPPTAEGRLAVARKIVQAAEKAGIARQDIYIDCLVQTASAEQGQVVETLKAVQMVKEELGVSTILGVSNVSHGLPAREILNSTFLALAKGRGLDLPIMNPLDQRMRETLAAVQVFSNQDANCAQFIQKYKSYVGTPGSPTGFSGTAGRVASADTDLGAAELAGSGDEAELSPDEQVKKLIFQAVVTGNRGSIQDLLQQGLDAGIDPLTLVNETMIPAIELVGQLYEDQTYFLPQLILGAETMKSGFAVLKPYLNKETAEQGKKIILATVQGDIHDIGKNIVAVMLENYGFQVIDLGKDVPNQEIIAVAEREKADLIGLSALMTTTMPRMAEVIQEIKTRNLDVQVLVGGAVVTPEYAEKIQADAYASDARAGVLRALELVQKRQVIN